MLCNYDLEELIGCGTFGNVYLVRCKLSGNPYVLKEVRISNMSPAERQQALTEVAVLKRCHHKNIIRYKEATLGKDRGMLSIVMEYAECGDMYTAIKRQQGVYFKECNVISWFIQITLALQYIHNRNILHRDLKTQNLFLTSNKMIKVGDFGIARVLKEDKELATTAIGTPYYLSPEICQRKPYNCKSDMWALGCILFEITALVHPFHGQNFHELVCAILTVQHKELPSHTSKLIQDLIALLLSANPEKRPSADEILSIPALQSHLYRYIETHTSPPKEIAKRYVEVGSSSKCDGFRRFSADDILNVQFPQSIDRRRPSVSIPQKGYNRIKNGVLKIPNFLSNSSSIHKKQKDSFKIPKSELKLNKGLVSSPQRESLQPKKVDILSKGNATKNPISRTYTLFKKAVEKSEQVISQMNKSPRSNDSISSIHIDKGTKNSLQCCCESCHTEVVAGCDNHFETTELLQNGDISEIKENFDEVFVDTEHLSSSVPLMPNSHDFPQCPHVFQCFHCVINTFWRNRITCEKNGSETERARLKKELMKVFGKKEFDDIYHTMCNAWEDVSEKTQSIDAILKIISFEQQQLIPLFIQLIQLETVSRSSAVSF